MPELVEKGEIENCHYFTYASLESRGLERPEQRPPCSSLSSPSSPSSWAGSTSYPDPRPGKRCLKAENEVQLSGIILLIIQNKTTATSLNCFLVRHFEIEVDFFGQQCNYCSHHVRI